MAAQLTNPFLLDAGKPWRARLTQITTPTLVLHGSTDPLFPIEHGKALANEIPGARFITLDNMGHAQISPNTWSVIRQAVREFTV